MPSSRVGQVDTGVGVHEAVRGLGDAQRAPPPQDPSGLALDELRSWPRACPSIATTRPSDLDTTLEVTTTRSWWISVCPSRSSASSSRVGQVVAFGDLADAAQRDDAQLAHATTAVARRREFSSLDMTVVVTRTSRPLARRSSAVAGVGLVDDERADRARRSSRRRRRSSRRSRVRASRRAAGPLIASPPTSGETATTSSRRRPEHVAHPGNRQDRADRDQRVGRRDHDAPGVAQRVDDAGRRSGRAPRPRR